ncbi:transcription antitermination factor NusB [bacterium]
MGKRRQAREIAMQVLYNIDVCDFNRQEAWECFGRKCQGGDIDDIFTFAKELVDGVLANREVIDAQISAVIKNWDLHRLAAVDRTVLRLASFEMLFLTEIPVSVVINEAVEIAKSFSTNDSGKFVNGVIDKLKGRRGIYERAYPI